MVKSMTAYAQAKLDTQIGQLSCEMRSVNHRYLDIAPRMPDELRVLENELRETIGRHLSRGRIDCFIRLQEDAASELEPDATVAGQLSALVETMQEAVPGMQPIRAIDVLRWPGVLKKKEISAQEMKAPFLAMIEQCLDQLVEARGKEGEKMFEMISQRLSAMREIVADVSELMPQIQEQYRSRLEEKLADIKDQLDPSRLEQEMVIFLQKSDVAEELDRLVVHIDEVASNLKKNTPVGRRLDFLMQELNREANTLGSKAQDTRLTKASVDLKVLIEQMREQVQNIE